MIDLTQILSKNNFSLEDKKHLQHMLDVKYELPIRSVIMPNFKRIKAVCTKLEITDLIPPLKSVIAACKLRDAIDLAKPGFRQGLNPFECLQQFEEVVAKSSTDLVLEKDIHWARGKLFQGLSNIAQDEWKTVFGSALKLLEAKQEVELKKIYERANYNEKKRLYHAGYSDVTVSFRLRYAFEKKDIDDLVGKVSIGEVAEAYNPKAGCRYLFPFIIHALKQGDDISPLIPKMGKGGIQQFEQKLFATGKWDQLVKLYFRYKRKDAQRLIDAMPDKKIAEALAKQKRCLKALWEMGSTLELKDLPKENTIYRLGLFMRAGHTPSWRDVQALMKTPYHPILKEAYARLKPNQQRAMVQVWPKLLNPAEIKDPTRFAAETGNLSIEECLGYLNGNAAPFLMALLSVRPTSQWESIVAKFPDGQVPKQYKVRFVKLACKTSTGLSFFLNKHPEDLATLPHIKSYTGKSYPDGFSQVMQKLYENLQAGSVVGVDPNKLSFEGALYYAGVVLKKNVRSRISHASKALELFATERSQLATQLAGDLRETVIDIETAKLLVSLNRLSDERAALFKEGFFKGEKFLIARVTVFLSELPVQGGRRLCPESMKPALDELFSLHWRETGLCKHVISQLKEDVKQDYLRAIITQADEKGAEDALKAIKLLCRSLYKKKDAGLTKDLLFACDLKAPRLLHAGLMALLLESMHPEDRGARLTVKLKGNQPLLEEMWKAARVTCNSQDSATFAKTHPDLALSMAFFWRDFIRDFAQQYRSFSSKVGVVLEQVHNRFYSLAPLKDYLSDRTKDPAFSQVIDEASMDQVNFLLSEGCRKDALKVLQTYTKETPYYGELSDFLGVWQTMYVSSLGDESESKALLAMTREPMIATEKGVQSMIDLPDGKAMLAKTAPGCLSTDIKGPLHKWIGGLLVNGTDGELKAAAITLKSCSEKPTVEMQELLIVELKKPSHSKFQFSLLCEAVKFAKDPMAVCKVVGRDQYIQKDLDDQGVTKNLAIVIKALSALNGRGETWANLHRAICKEFCQHYPLRSKRILDLMWIAPAKLRPFLVKDYVVSLCGQTKIPVSTALFKLFAEEKYTLQPEITSQFYLIAFRGAKDRHERARLMSGIVSEIGGVEEKLKALKEDERELCHKLAWFWSRLSAYPLGKITSVDVEDHVLHMSAVWHRHLQRQNLWNDIFSKGDNKDKVMAAVCSVKQEALLELDCFKPYLSNKQKDVAVSYEIDTARLRMLDAGAKDAYRKRVVGDGYYGCHDVWWELEETLWEKGYNLERLFKAAANVCIWNGKKLVSLYELDKERLIECMRQQKDKLPQLFKKYPTLFSAELRKRVCE